jgi:hypothetical protein
MYTYVYIHTCCTYYIYSHILSPTALLLLIANVQKIRTTKNCVCLNHTDTNTISFVCARALAHQYSRGLRLMFIILIFLFIYLFVFLKKNLVWNWRPWHCVARGVSGIIHESKCIFLILAIQNHVTRHKTSDVIKVDYFNSCATLSLTQIFLLKRVVLVRKRTSHHAVLPRNNL